MTPNYDEYYKDSPTDPDEYQAYAELVETLLQVNHYLTNGFERFGIVVTRCFDFSELTSSVISIGQFNDSELNARENQLIKSDEDPAEYRNLLELLNLYEKANSGLQLPLRPTCGLVRDYNNLVSRALLTPELKTQIETAQKQRSSDYGKLPHKPSREAAKICITYARDRWKEQLENDNPVLRKKAMIDELIDHLLSTDSYIPENKYDIIWKWIKDAQKNNLLVIPPGVQSPGRPKKTR